MNCPKCGTDKVTITELFSTVDVQCFYCDVAKLWGDPAQEISPTRDFVVTKVSPGAKRAHWPDVWKKILEETEKRKQEDEYPGLYSD